MGAQREKMQRSTLILAATLLLVFVGVLSSTAYYTYTVLGAHSSGEADSATYQTYRFGETVTLENNVVVTVAAPEPYDDHADASSYSGAAGDVGHTSSAARPTADNTEITVQVKLTNNTSTKLAIMELELSAGSTARSATQKEYRPVRIDGRDLGEQATPFGALPPGVTATATYGFSIPLDLEHLYVALSTYDLVEDVTGAEFLVFTDGE